MDEDFAEDDMYWGDMVGAGGDRGADGPSPVLLSVCVDPPPAPNETVCVTVKAPNGTATYTRAAMEVCGTGERRLWRTTVQLEPPAGEGGRRGARRPLHMGNLRSRFLGGPERAGPEIEKEEELPALFQVQYCVMNAAGTVVREEKAKQHEEVGHKLSPCYYHKAQLGGDGKIEPFPLFVEEEIHEVQWNPHILQDYLVRVQELCHAKFSTERPLLDGVLKTLIERHWAGQRQQPVCVLAVAALLGQYLKKRSQRENSTFDGIVGGVLGLGRGLGLDGGKDKEKAKPQPLPSSVCRWIVANWTRDIDNVGAPAEGDAAAASAVAAAAEFARVSAKAAAKPSGPGPASSQQAKASAPPASSAPPKAKAEAPKPEGKAEGKGDGKAEGKGEGKGEGKANGKGEGKGDDKGKGDGKGKGKDEKGAPKAAPEAKAAEPTPPSAPETPGAKAAPMTPPGGVDLAFSPPPPAATAAAAANSSGSGNHPAGSPGPASLFRGGANGPMGRDYGGREEESKKIGRLRNVAYSGLKECANTLYVEEKSFEWFNLLTIVSDHQLPQAMDASRLDEKEAVQLMKNFQGEASEQLKKLLGSYEEQEVAIQRIKDQKQRTMAEMELQRFVQRILEGLYSFCPSVASLRWLMENSKNALPKSIAVLTQLLLSRLRTIAFGKADKEALQKMIGEIPYTQPEEIAVNLLENPNHPSKGFPAEEVIDFVRLIMRKDQAQGPLVESAKRWLRRHFARQSASAGAGDERFQQETKRAIAHAITGWELVSGLPCFDNGQIKMILFDLSQSHFFKDPEPLLLLGCLLELEDRVQGINVPDLRNEVLTIGIRAVRNAQEAVDELKVSDPLMKLLFRDPTPLRFVFIEALIGQRNAFPGLRSMLSNASIWSALFSPNWEQSKVIGKSNLGETVRKGRELLLQMRSALSDNTIRLGDLNVIASLDKAYCSLASLALKEDLGAKVNNCVGHLKTFDMKLEQLGVYTKMFCSSNGGAGEIEVADLEKLVEDVRDRYDMTPLKDAMPRLDKVTVWPHLGFLYSLRGSNVFATIWAQVRADKGKMVGGALSQDQVVKEVIATAQKDWETLAGGVVKGTVPMGEVEWIVDFDWQAVDVELKVLESTTKAGAENKGAWGKASECCKAMRFGARLRKLGPAVLRLREDLKTLFKEAFAKDPAVPEIQKLSEEVGKMLDMPLAKSTELVAPYRETFSMLKERSEEFVLLSANKTAPLTWLATEAKSTDSFNGLIEVCRPNTDDPRVLGGIAAMQQVRTLFAEALYTKPPYANTKDFLMAIGAISIEETDLRALEATQVNFDPLLDLLTKKARTPGVQACYDLKALCDSGTFVITCTPRKSDQLVCTVNKDSKPWRRQELADLRQQLLMTDVPPELEQQAELPKLIEDFVARCQLLEEYSQCTQELFNLGYFDLEIGDQVLTLRPADSVATMASRLEELNQKLVNWENAVKTERGRYYFLNYFTVYELRLMFKQVRALMSSSNKSDAAWMAVWPLLRTVAPEIDEAKTRRALTEFRGDPKDPLGLLGRLFNELFEHVKPRLRPLNGLSGLSSDEQGDLLIRKNEAGEQGVPIFVCTVDEETKVTEAVLSIYARRDRVPETEELLMCSSTTTAEEIELLVRRFLLARQHGREDLVFCLGSTHLLPYATQCRAAEVLRWLEERVGFGSASCLAVVSGGKRQQVLGNALLSRKAHAVGFPAEPRGGFLREAVNVVGRIYHGRPIEAVASDINGGGKSSRIYRQVAQLQHSVAGGQPIYHRVDVRETTDASALVGELLSDSTDRAYPTAIHLNLAHILPAHVDTLLFQLLIVGVLHDARLGVVYHRRPQDFFFVEIPNTPNEQTARSLPFVMLLPRTFCKVEAATLSLDKPLLIEKPGGTIIEIVKDEDLVLLGKFLAAMEIEEFNPVNKKSFNIEWALDKAAEVEPQELYRLMENVCCQENEPPSWLLFCGLKNFLATLLKLQEKFPVGSKLQLQKQLQFNGLKHSFIKLLIETSRAFALRQIPKGNIDFEAHPLAPPAPSVPQLMRQLTLTRETSLGTREAPTLNRQGSRGGGGAPSLTRQASRTNQGEAGRGDTVPAAVDELAVETSGVGRIVVTSYVSRFAQMQSWETMEHPVAYFVLGPTGNVQGCQVMSLNPEYVSQFIPQQLQRTLELQGITLKKDWSKATHQEAVKCVLDVEGGRSAEQKYNIGGPEEYVVTVDNLIKLMTIQQRLKYGLPVCLMGETGCGKTALVRFLAKTLEIPLLTLDVHGGITEVDIMGFMDRALARGEELPDGAGGGVLVFFDEVNAANCMGLFKTIIVDRMHRGRPLPANVRVVSCCNPYRQRTNKELEAVALTYEHKGEGGEATGIVDPMRNLVYRVHPLPESLMDVVSDFGALTDKSQALYIRAILCKELMPPMEVQLQKDKKAAEAKAAAKAAPRPGMGARPGAAPAGPPAAEEADDSEYDHFISAFRDLLCASQMFVREAHDGERSVVSMRDIARAVRVCKWFLTYYARLKGVQSPAKLTRESKALSHGVSSPAVRISVDEVFRPHLRSALILTLGYCYHARLAREQRKDYRVRLCKEFATIVEKKPNMKWLDLSSEAELEKQLVSVQYEFVSQMQLGEDIALNEALRENLFMLLVSIMNQIPILLVGKPGCSKSLAMDILKSNLNGEVSEREFFRSMPAVEVFAYQCSPLSTPEAILYAFESARRSNIGDKRTIVCVLLDEVGLAEESPHLPLKVLHRELEHLEGIACVGISNWALDAAKMNRCVMLYRPPPTVEDLRATAEGMAGKSANLRGYLRALSEAFFDIYGNQKQRDFWGMREFYSTIRALNVELRAQAARGEESALQPAMIMKAVLRNFGGRPREDVEACVAEFFDRVGMSSKGLPWHSKEQLIKQNLAEPDARHLMLLTRNNAALRLLFETGLLGHQSAEVMFGGTFPGDQSDVFVAMNLQRVKTYMQRPVCLIMVHCDALYESLYDLLNQHYMEYAGQRYVRIAHGSMSKQCPIHKAFRIIVIVEEHDAYYRLAPPLLNRFEKQVFQRRDLMSGTDNALRARVMQFWDALLEGLVLQEGRGSKSVAVQRCAVAGFHPELLGSLVFALRRRKPDAAADDLFAEARRALVWVLTPEAVCLMAARPALRQALGGFDLVQEYFKDQQHIDLPTFAGNLLKNQSLWCDEYGAQVVTMTYSPLRGKVGDIILRELKDIPKRCAPFKEVMLHELSASQDLEKEVTNFYRKANGELFNIMLIRADTSACSLRMIEYTRFVCEKARTDFVQKEGSPKGSVFVMMVVHLERGYSGFSFDFDSQWQFAFLDSIEPVVHEDSCGLPALSEMLHAPLLQVVEGCDFATLLRRTFREALARLVYPHRRMSTDLQSQVKQFLMDLDDRDFVAIVRNWALAVLDTTPKRGRKAGEDNERAMQEVPEPQGPPPQAEPKAKAKAEPKAEPKAPPEAPKPQQQAPRETGPMTVGKDTEWFADVAAAAQELMLAGTLRAALHQRILTLVTSLLTVVMAHLDRNGGYALLADKGKRNTWMQLVPATLTSPLSVRLKMEAELAATEISTARREVATDAQTPERTFESRFPCSWFVSKTLDNLHPTIKPMPRQEQQQALETHYKLTPLHAIGFNPIVDRGLLADYLSDFTAMHVDWMPGIDREKQTELMRVVLTRAKGSELSSILEIHCLFWQYEKQVRFCAGLVDSVPAAIRDVEKLIETAPLQELNARLLLAVHRILIRELQEARGEPREVYRFWLHRKMMVGGLTEDFFIEQGADRQNTPPLIAELLSDTEPRLETLALFVRYVAYPLSLPCSEVPPLINDLPNGQLRCTSSFAAVLKAADRTSMATGGSESDTALDCSRAFVEAWVLEVCLKDPASTVYIEPYLVRLFCHVATGLPVKLDPKTVAGIVAVGLEEDTDLDLDEVTASPLAVLSRDYLPRLPSFSLALLRKLLRGLVGEVQNTSSQTLQELLVLFMKKKGHNDSVFSKNYAIVREEGAAQRLSRAGGPSRWPQINLQMVAPTAAPDKTLLYIGHLRWMLTQYAMEICQPVPDPAMLEAMDAKLKQVLCDFDGDLAPLSRMMRLFVMKTIERTKGVTYLRGILATEPVCKADWVSMWRGRHDLNFEKFIGSAKVPTWTPFILDDSPQEFGTMRGAVLALIASSSTSKLEACFQKASSWPEYQRRRNVGALLLALCAEPGMLAPLEEDARARPPWRSVLTTWLKTNKELPVNSRERNLLLIFAGDDTKLNSLYGASAAPLQKLFSITGGRPMDALFIWRFLGHLAASLVAAPSTSILASLRTLMLEPDTMMASQQTDYLVAMDEDIRHRIQRAFGQGAGYTFANHWYKCNTCGNKFYIGECSKPMQEAKCPGCGAIIGGSSHRPTAQTVQDETVDSSPAGYTLPKAAEDEKQLFFRDVHATSARIMRVLLHGAMCCGLAAQLPETSDDPRGAGKDEDGHAQEAQKDSGPMVTGATRRKMQEENKPDAKNPKTSVKDIMTRVYGHITNSDSTCTMHQETEAIYLTDHLYQDWTLLADNLSSHSEGTAMGMHTLLQQMSKRGPDPPQKRKQKVEHWWDRQRQDAPEDQQAEWGRLSTLKRRALWEETCDEKYLLPFIGKFEETVTLLQKRWSNKEDESGPLVAELRETADVATFPVESRYSQVPQVLAYRAPVTLSEVQRRLPQAKKTMDLTVLSTLLQTHVLETVKALRTLVGQFQWHSLVEQRFSGRITRQDAQDVTVAQAIENEPRAERGQWEHSYNQLESAWQDAFKYVDRFECLEIPAALKTFYITRDSPLHCAIADEKDLGICPLVLTQWLVARHNDLVQSAALAGGYPIRKATSTTVGHHDVVVYDKEMLMRFIRDRCVTHGAGGKLNLDFVELERHLRHEFARPELSFHLRLFQWLGESSSGSNSLAQLIPQRDLPPEVESRLRGEIRTPVLAAGALQKLQMAATFIVNSRDSLNSEVMAGMKVSDYLSSVLAEPQDSLPSSTARSEVHLCHVDAFVRMLKGVIHSDPMEQLPFKYKAELESDLKKKVCKAATEMPELVERIVRAMQGLVDNMQDGGADQEQKMSDWLCAYLEMIFEDSEAADAVGSHFPADLKLKHWNATYLALKQTLESGDSTTSL